VCFTSIVCAQTSYQQDLQVIKQKQVSYRVAYQSADSLAKDSLITSARAFLFQEITSKIFPRWYGTQWDFNGITRVPKEGYIACGYFITTVMEAVGFSIPRYKWAQLGAEDIIVKISPQTLKRFRNRPLSEVEQYLLKKGDGLYVVGLDNHVGFLVVKGKTVRFVHSNYYHADIGVMSEPIYGNNPLNDSSYRIIGTLFTDIMIENWIQGVVMK